MRWFNGIGAGNTQPKYHKVAIDDRGENRYMVRRILVAGLIFLVLPGQVAFNRQREKKISKAIKKFDPSIVPLVFWRCPVCQEEDTLSVKNTFRGYFLSKTAIECTVCGATWRNVYAEAMTLVAGPAALRGTKSMEEWAKLSYASGIEIKPGNRAFSQSEVSSTFYQRST